MKYLLLLLFSLTSLNVSAADTLSDITQLTWKNRIILAWGDSAESFRDQLARARAEIDERDIVWFVIDGTKVTTNYNGKISPNFAENTRGNYHGSAPQVLLIGKDGGVKESDTELLLDALLREIDAMPMRQNEMRKDSEAGVGR